MRRLAVAAAAAVAFFFSPDPAAAQDFRATITRQLEAAAGQASTGGYRIDANVIDRQMVIGALPDDGSVYLELNLTGGVEYFIAAGCDEDCSDLDTRIYPAGENDAIDEDIEDDDVPMLAFTAPRNGRYLLHVSMAECDESICYFGYQVYRK